MYSVIVGVGNPLLGDDAVGLEVAKRLKGVVEYDLAIIIDAFKGKGIKEIDVDDYEESVANHDINFPSAYRILRRYVKMPKVRVIGIGVDGIEIKEELSPKIKKMIPEVVKKVKEIMEEENEFAV